MSARVAVVGGGILGAATAAELARRGATVTLLTERGLCSEASGRTLSWLNSFGRIAPDYHRLRLLGIDRYRRRAADPATREAITFAGGLAWRPPDQHDGLIAAYEHMLDAEYPAEWFDHADVAARVPGVDPTSVPDTGAVYNPTEGWVHVPDLVETLAGEMERAGGEIRTEVGPAAIAHDGDHVTGVRLADGSTIEVDAAVLATGARVPSMLAEAGVRIPDATSVAALVRTEPVETELAAVLNTARVALRPAPDGSLVMDSAAGNAAAVAHPDGSFTVPDDAVTTLLADATRVLAGNPELRVRSHGVGLKPIPGDERPVVGELDDVRGYHVAFTHSGATLGLILGELLAEEILAGTRRDELEPFRPHRFA
ncbi:NAD(P)/FAD-dependent oxidoreductase [Ruania alba]|uniref:Glycine/D-amino acid oxidase n=1 Tax=Ruania alba TaxID=648782 RepID=A0A1H5HQ27_9MICO|nr:FAD-binding oxidoreductase [Ruania alba]SEE30072.1 Glycine/D-amino acid oxidase [Ruania alba]